MASKTVRLWFSAVGLGVITHLAVSLLMVIRRVFALTEERLKIARTGAENAEIKQLPRQKVS